jgi:hypothetical protein
MKRREPVCGLVFIKFCVLNDKVDIYRIIGNGSGGPPIMVRTAQASCRRLRPVGDSVGLTAKVVSILSE